MTFVKALSLYKNIFCKLSIYSSSLLMCACINGNVTEVDAQEARMALESGKSSMQLLANQFSNAMSTAEVIQPLKWLINEPPTQTIPQYYSNEITPHYGNYVENSAGSYDFGAASDIITIQKRNGIKIVASNFVYAGTRLASFRLVITPDNNGVTTPTAERINLDVTQERLAFLGESLPPLLSAGLRLTGKATFPNGSGGSASIDVRRSIGSFEDAGLFGGQSIHNGWLLHLTDVTSGVSKTWIERRIVRHIASDQLGVWVGDIAWDNFVGNGVRYNVAILLQSKNVSSTGLSVYNPFGAVYYKQRRVASLIGGPYNCDVNKPRTIGSGTTIQLSWLDGTLQNIFPNAENTCEKTIITIP